VLDERMRPPNSDEASVGIDYEVRPALSVAVVYVRKHGRDFIGWTDVGGRYRSETRALFDGSLLPVLVLEGRTADRRFLQTNPDGYSLGYDGLAILAGRRRSQGWLAAASYTFSRVSGLQPSSGATAAGAQAGTVAPPPAPAGITFGRDPNDLTNARGRLPNDRPHMLRVLGSVDIPRTGVVIAVNLQHLSGKPWAATALVSLPQNPQQRIFLEARGSRRLASQSLVDLRLSRTIDLGGLGHVDLVLDVLNALDDTAEESLVTDARQTETRNIPTFGRPNVFVDPRRAMVSVRLSLGR
jgi:hypothetical protein